MHVFLTRLTTFTSHLVSSSFLPTITTTTDDLAAGSTTAAQRCRHPLAQPPIFLALLPQHLTPYDHQHHLVAANSTTSELPPPAITFPSHSLSVQLPPPSSLVFFQSFSSQAPSIEPFRHPCCGPPWWPRHRPPAALTPSPPPIDLFPAISALFHSYLAEPHPCPSRFYYAPLLRAALPARPSGHLHSTRPSSSFLLTPQLRSSCTL